MGIKSVVAGSREAGLQACTHNAMENICLPATKLTCFIGADTKIGASSSRKLKSRAMSPDPNRAVRSFVSVQTLSKQD